MFLFPFLETETSEFGEKVLNERSEFRNLTPQNKVAQRIRKSGIMASKDAQLEIENCRILVSYVLIVRGRNFLITL